MLGSFFDLKREVARIAAERAAKQTKEPDRRSRAYSEFDDQLRDFISLATRRVEPEQLQMPRYTSPHHVDRE